MIVCRKESIAEKLLTAVGLAISLIRHVQCRNKVAGSALEFSRRGGGDVVLLRRMKFAGGRKERAKRAYVRAHDHCGVQGKATLPCVQPAKSTL